MIAFLLGRIPLHAYELLLVYDPDGLLGPHVRAELAARGARLVEAEDNVRLWAAVDAMQPWALEQPVVIISARPLNELPYDLWAQGYRVELSVADLAPRLVASVARQLTPHQLERLVLAEQPARRLGPGATAAYLLEHVFAVDPPRLERPGELLLWLNDVHADLGPLPSALQSYLVETLGRLAVYADWPLQELLRDAGSLRAFCQRAWSAYISGHTYPLATPFKEKRVQDSLGALVRYGMLEPVAVAEAGALPPWAQPGISHDPVQQPMQALGDALDAVGARLGDAADWSAWSEIAWHWAQATTLIYGKVALPAEAAARYEELAGELDTAFAAWLRQDYTPLSGRRLPTPHHVHHVPHWLALQRRQKGGTGRIALLVLDGLSLADWLLLRAAWQERHPEWALEERLLLAQIPTITSISRQALVSGLRPASFAESLYTTAHEARGWQAFWSGQGLIGDVIAYARLALDRAPVPAIVESNLLAALCLVDHSIDELIHGASLGAAQVQDGLQRWLDGYAPRLEELIVDLLARGLRVHLASDHGHVEAMGMGRPREGILAETKGQRARLYTDRSLARGVRDGFDAELWGDDALLPEGVWAVMPRGRGAYATHNERIVTHGGITLDEVVVPFITIASKTPCQ